MDWTEISRIPDFGPVPMQQHPAYGRACLAAGGRIATFGLGPKREITARAQVLLRRWPLIGEVAMIARGPVWAEPPSRDDAQDSARSLVGMLRKSCRVVVLSPDPIGTEEPMAHSGMLPMMTGGVEARLSLEGDEAARLARMQGKWRNRLRRALEEDLDLTQGPLPADHTHWLLQREAAQARERGYRRLPLSFTQAWRVQNGARSTRVFTASFQGLPVAAMLFLLHGSSATYHIGWTGKVGRETGAHALLLHEASRWLARRGYLWVELGTLDTDRSPGLARFKLGAGARPQPLGSSWIVAPGTRLCAQIWGHGAQIQPRSKVAAPMTGPGPAPAE